MSWQLLFFKEQIGAPENLFPRLGQSSQLTAVPRAPKCKGWSSPDLDCRNLEDAIGTSLNLACGRLLGTLCQSTDSFSLGPLFLCIRRTLPSERDDGLGFIQLLLPAKEHAQTINPTRSHPPTFLMDSRHLRDGFNRKSVELSDTNLVHKLP